MPKRVALDLLLLLAYVLVSWLLYQCSSRFWFPGAGLRFAFLLYAPRRLFVPLMFSELVAYRSLDAIWPGITGVVHPDSAWIEAGRAVCAGICPWLLRRTGVMRPNAMSAMDYCMFAGMITSMLVAFWNLSYPWALQTQIPLGMLFLQMMLGDYIGLLVVVPIAVIVMQRPPPPTYRRRWHYDLPLVLLPALLGSGLLMKDATSASGYFFAAALGLVAAIWVTFRTGWRGAAVSFSAISVVIAMLSLFNRQMTFAMESQLYLATSGSIGLLMGGSIDSMRESRRRLRAQADELRRSNARLDELAEQLRDVARRSLTLSEDLRRWITSELHDELGQNISALQVRLKIGETLYAQNVRDSALVHAQHFAPMREILQHMRGTVSGLLRDLRPAGLDEFGLQRALSEGSLRMLIESAGLDYSLCIGDDAALLDRLDNNVQTALYRIVQEAATNTLRHANAQRFRVRLHLRKSEADTCIVVLYCADDGEGIRPEHRGGIGLHGIRDRVLSFGGHMRLRSGCNGTRLLVALNFPLSAISPDFRGFQANEP